MKLILGYPSFEEKNTTVYQTFFSGTIASNKLKNFYSVTCKMHQLLHLKWTPPRRLSRSSSGFSLLTNPNRFFRSSFLKVVAPPPRSPFKRADRLRATGKRTKQMSWPLLGLSGCYWTDLASFSIRSFKLLLPFPSALPSLSCREQNTFTMFTWGQPAKDICSLSVHKTVSYLCSRENSSGWSLM